MEANIEANGDKLSILKHDIEKMKQFENYIQSPRVRAHYKKCLKILVDKIYEAVDV